MKKLIIAVSVLLTSCAPALYVNYLDSAKKYKSISPNDVKIFLDEKELPAEFEKVALIEIKNADSDADAYGDMRKEASKIGCNGIIQLENKENGNMSVGIGLYRGIDVTSKTNQKFLAIRFQVDGKYPKHVKQQVDDMY